MMRRRKEVAKAVGVSSDGLKRRIGATAFTPRVFTALGSCTIAFAVAGGVEPTRIGSCICSVTARAPPIT